MMQLEIELDLLATESPTEWGIYREASNYALEQADNHPGVEVFVVPVNIDEEVTKIRVHRDGSLESKAVVQNLMKNWIETAGGI